MNNKKIWDYFDESVDYPKEIVHDPIPYGTVWNYISSTFLNGLINYVDPIKFYVLKRYSGDDEPVQIACRGSGPDYKNFEYEGTKGELIELILSSKIKVHHTRLCDFEDDIIILSKIKTNEEDGINRFMFFWFDCDVSDCSIGKFETTDTQKDVEQSVINWLEECKKENGGPTGQIVVEFFDNGILDYIELPISFLSGWIKF